jgi:Domain of unknown function (DUF3883)
MLPKLSDLTSSAAVQAALDEFIALGQDRFLAKYGFGKAREYVVRDPRSGTWADSKAIAGAALAHQFPGTRGLSASDFSGGDATVLARLSALGFEVRQIKDIVGSDWNEEEVALTVADYLRMLTFELSGQSYNKAAHRRALLRHLPGRTDQAVEFKHANISAVMLELGYPYLRGYKPRSNFQRSRLLDEVEKQVARLPLLDEAAMVAVQQPAAMAECEDFSKVLAQAPRTEMTAREPEKAYGKRTAIRRDYLEREARNRSLGLAGEQFALRFEQWRLAEIGVGQLAERVRHVSTEQGDGLGFDILSFEPDGRERFIEVKTTAFGERTPFFVSANEVRFARETGPQFYLYRLFDFKASPRLFEMAGPIEQHCALDATTFRASFG